MRNAPISGRGLTTDENGCFYFQRRRESMISTADFRNGTAILLDGNLYTIVEFQHVKPGKGVAFVRTRLKNVKTGAVTEKTFRSGEKFEDVRLERREMQYLYGDGDTFHLMDTETYEQISLSADQVKESALFLKENEIVSVLLADGDPVGMELPFFVTLRIVQTDPGIRGDTATGGSKPAVLETGGTVQVPLFVDVEETIKVDTRTGTYVERVS
jgi:elongation factor P